eukprot:1467173-Lingulodinium_polyedra.AAC.1
MRRAVFSLRAECAGVRFVIRCASEASIRLRRSVFETSRNRAVATTSHCRSCSRIARSRVPCAA